MPLTHFLGLILMVSLAAALTLLLAVWSGLPLAAVGFAAVSASLILAWTRVGR